MKKYCEQPLSSWTCGYAVWRVTLALANMWVNIRHPQDPGGSTSRGLFEFFNFVAVSMYIFGFILMGEVPGENYACPGILVVSVGFCGAHGPAVCIAGGSGGALEKAPAIGR